jgi:hypothetical protein
MDKKNVFWMIGMFLVGAVIGGVIIGLFCRNCNNSCRESCKDSCKENSIVVQSDKDMLPGSHPLLITADSANAYFKCYMKSPQSIAQFIAFTVNLQQLEAMQTLLAQDSTATGFRIYMGIVGDPVAVNMVVATDNAGNDNVSKIYMTRASGPCPVLCGKDSPITK